MGRGPRRIETVACWVAAGATVTKASSVAHRSASTPGVLPAQLRSTSAAARPPIIPAARPSGPARHHAQSPLHRQRPAGDRRHAPTARVSLSRRRPRGRPSWLADRGPRLPAACKLRWTLTPTRSAARQDAGRLPPQAPLAKGRANSMRAGPHPASMVLPRAVRRRAPPICAARPRRLRHRRRCRTPP